MLWGFQEKLSLNAKYYYNLFWLTREEPLSGKKPHFLQKKAEEKKIYLHPACLFCWITLLTCGFTWTEFLFQFLPNEKMIDRFWCSWFWHVNSSECLLEKNRLERYLGNFFFIWNECICDGPSANGESRIIFIDLLTEEITLPTAELNLPRLLIYSWQEFRHSWSNAEVICQD